MLCLSLHTAWQAPQRETPPSSGSGAQRPTAPACRPQGVFITGFVQSLIQRQQQEERGGTELPAAGSLPRHPQWPELVRSSAPTCSWEFHLVLPCGWWGSSQPQGLLEREAGKGMWGLDPEASPKATQLGSPSSLPLILFPTERINIYARRPEPARPGTEGPASEGPSQEIAHRALLTRTALPSLGRK